MKFPVTILVFATILAGCQTTPAPTPIVVKPPPPKPVAVVEKETQNDDVSDVINVDVSKLIANPSAKMLPFILQRGYCITLASNIGMPVITPVELQKGTILQITARVCNRGPETRTLDFICQVDQQKFHYQLEKIVLPGYKARDLRIRINAPDSDSSIWLTVRDSSNIPRPTVHGVTLNTKKSLADADEIRVSTIVPDPIPDNKE